LQDATGLNHFRNDSRGNRNELAITQYSLADASRARYFLLENVREYATVGGGMFFLAGVLSLLEVGYQVRVGALGASFYGLAQERWRLLMMGSAPGSILPEWPAAQTASPAAAAPLPLPGGASLLAQPAARFAPHEPLCVADVMADLPAIGNARTGDDALAYATAADACSLFALRSRRPLLAGDAPPSHVLNHASRPLDELNLARVSLLPTEQAVGWQHLRQLVRDGDACVDDFVTRFGPNVPVVPVWIMNMGGLPRVCSRLCWDETSCVVMGFLYPWHKTGGVIHPLQHRIISVREAARLQGFPDWFVFLGTLVQQYQQVGNAVPPPLAAAVGRSVLAARYLEML